MIHPCSVDLTNPSSSTSWSLPSDINATVSVEAIRLLKQVSYAYISPVVIFFGIFGDLMSLLVLSHPVLRASSVVYLYLMALSGTDLCTLMSTIPMILWLIDVKLCTKSAAFYYAHIGFPLANAFMSASVWIVVFFTLAQYVAVCYPFVNTFRSKKVCFVLTTIAYVLSAAIYIPWGWRKTVRYVGHVQVRMIIGSKIRFLPNLTLMRDEKSTIYCSLIFHPVFAVLFFFHPMSRISFVMVFLRNIFYSD